MPTLARELGKQNPFDLPEQEAYLNLIRTAAALEAPTAALFKKHGLSPSAYNALRILRGAGARTCGQILEHMVVRAPDVTRLVDRLIADGLAERTRSDEDRRVVLVRITRKGRALVDRLDAPVRDLHAEHLGHLSRRDLDTLNRLLVKARTRDPGPQHPTTET